MLVIVSNTVAVAGEAGIINGLFEEGMETLHLRKPGVCVDEIKILLEKIKPAYRRRIVLHQHHDLANDFGITRLHFTEAKRKETSEVQLAACKASGHILSTSIHRVEDYNRLTPCFNYTFFGPVFDSISKQGYRPAIGSGFIFPVRKNGSDVIAIGGIDATNIHQAVEMGFNGVAVLGAVWQKPDESVQQFKMIQKVWKQAGLSY